MSAGFHRLGANKPGHLIDWSNVLGSGPLSYVAAPVVRVRDEIAIPAAQEARPDVGTFELGSPITSRTLARQQGYTGDQCSNCFSMKMKMAGHCMVCENCGTTTGCS